MLKCSLYFGHRRYEHDAITYHIVVYWAALFQSQFLSLLGFAIFDFRGMLSFLSPHSVPFSVHIKNLWSASVKSADSFWIDPRGVMGRGLMQSLMIGPELNANLFFPELKPMLNRSRQRGKKNLHWSLHLLSSHTADASLRMQAVHCMELIDSSCCESSICCERHAEPQDRLTLSYTETNKTISDQSDVQLW